MTQDPLSPGLSNRSSRTWTADDLALLSTATAAVVRLDERVKGASDAIRAGWLSRALLHEASASARLDEVYTDPHELLLMDQDVVEHLVDHGTRRAQQILELVRTAARRHPRQLFTPRRLMAAARRRLRQRAETTEYPEWLAERRADPDEIRGILECALDPVATASRRSWPALLGAADGLSRWHESGAAEVLGGAAGRALAAAWLRRCGLVEGSSFLPAVGFLGHAADYRPDGSVWVKSFLQASVRGAEWGLGLLRSLGRSEQRLREGAIPGRSNSHLPALVDLLVSLPAVSPPRAASLLGVTPAASRRLFDQLKSQNLIREITGRRSFRLFAVA